MRLFSPWLLSLSCGSLAGYLRGGERVVTMRLLQGVTSISIRGGSHHPGFLAARRR